MGQTIKLDSRVIDALEDVAVFSGTWDEHFFRGWEKTIKTFDDLWRWSCVAFYGRTTPAYDADSEDGERGRVIFDESLAFSALLSQIDYREEGE